MSQQLTQSQQTGLQQISLQTVGSISGLKLSRVQQLATFHQTQIQKLGPDAAINLVGNEIHTLAKEYGNREKIDDAVARECIGIIGDKFAYLSPKELRVAYRMWASGEIEVSKSAEMYGGQINARQVGAVLSAYAEWRKKDMAKYLSAVQQEREEKVREEKTAKAKAEFETNLFAELDEAVKDYEDWRQVKPYWFSALWKRKLIPMTDEQIEQIKVDATEEAKKERENREKTARDEGKLFEQVAEAEGIEKAIRCRLAVWRHYILTKRENPNNDNE